jgi:hypothetical protein
MATRRFNGCEIGIRIARASARSFATVLRAGLLAGGCFGLPAAYGVAPLLRMTTDGLDANEAAVYAGVASLLFAVAIAASASPALKAMRINPVRILRSECDGSIRLQRRPEQAQMKATRLPIRIARQTRSRKTNDMTARCAS